MSGTLVLSAIGVKEGGRLLDGSWGRRGLVVRAGVIGVEEQGGSVSPGSSIGRRVVVHAGYVGAGRGRGMAGRSRGTARACSTSAAPSHGAVAAADGAVVVAVGKVDRGAGARVCRRGIGRRGSAVYAGARLA